MTPTLPTCRDARALARLASSRGQSIVEFAICLPLLLLVTLGVIEMSNALMSQHVITKVAREGSNMISRETELVDAGTALQNMSANPGTFNARTLVIFSVLMRSQTGSNNGQLVLYQRYQVGNGVARRQPPERQRQLHRRQRLHRGQPEQHDEPARHQRADGHRVGAGRDDLRHRGLHVLRQHDAARQPRDLQHPDAERALLDRLLLSVATATVTRRDTMTRQRSMLARARNEEGFTLFYMAVFLVMLLLFVGLAVDTGRAYVVQAQLSKAVDGAALGAARMLNSGDPRQEAATIYRANFPVGWFGTTSSTDPTSSGFYQMTTVTATGVNVVTVTATAVVPTTFMKLANFQEVTVNATGEATRRMVDLSLVIDVSGSIGWRWPYVRDAARTFVDAFDERSDRLSLIFFGNGARVVDPMPAGRGFDKARADGRHPERAARRQHGDGAGPVPRLGRAAHRHRRASSPACASSCSSPTARRTACLASGPAHAAVTRLSNLRLPGQRRRPGQPDARESADWTGSTTRPQHDRRESDHGFPDHDPGTFYPTLNCDTVCRPAAGAATR